MRADVWFGVTEVAPADVAGRVVAVIDVLRASTTITVALANGARAIIPCASAEEASLRAKALTRTDLRLAGERKMRPIPGFDLGNSPTEFTREAVDGKTIVFATTNGTPALLAVQAGGAADVVVAAYVNFSAVLVLLRTALRGGTDITLLCAGQDRRFALEDALCAGRYLRKLTADFSTVGHNDAALACLALEQRFGGGGGDGAGLLPAVFTASEHGRALAESGYAKDLDLCAALDAYPVVPIYQERQITKLGPGRSR